MYKSAEEMFMMIEGYAKGLLQHIRQEKEVPAEIVMELSRQIIQILKSAEVEGRVGIVILLNAACALYEVATEQQEAMSPCPPEHLN